MAHGDAVVAVGFDPRRMSLAGECWIGGDQQVVAILAAESRTDARQFRRQRGDAVDLGWKLAGTLQGWGGPGLLASYEHDRRQIGEKIIRLKRDLEEVKRTCETYNKLGEQAKKEGLQMMTHNEGFENSRLMRSPALAGGSM